MSTQNAPAANVPSGEKPRGILAGRHANWLIVALLITMTAIAFIPVLTCDFVNYDDPTYVTRNERVQQGVSLANLKWALGYAYGHWIPLDTISHMIDCHLFGLNASGHHAVSLLFHLINVALLYLLLARVTGMRGRSLIVAGLFALHPIHVEPVAWISSRKDVLSTCLALLCLHAYAGYAKRANMGRYVAVAALFTLAMMAKPMVMTLPALLFLFDIWPLNRLEPPRLADPAWWRRCLMLALEKLPLFLISTAFVLLAFQTQQEVGALGTEEECPFPFRVQNAAVSYLIYLKKIVIPTGFVPFYPHPGVTLGWTKPLLAALVLAFITVAALLLWKRRPYLPAGWLWFAVSLFPVSSLVVQLGSHAMADRYAYMPFIGIYTAAVWGIADAARGRPLLHMAAPYCAGGILAALGVLSMAQATHWRDSVTLFTHTLRVSSNNHLAHKNLGVALAQQGKHEAAIAQYNAGLKIRGDDADLHYNVGNSFIELDMQDKAVEAFQKALARDPNHKESIYNLANTLARLGKYDEAIPHYRHMLEMDPNHLGARINFGNTLAISGKPAEAAEQYKAAINLDPNTGDAHVNLGNALASLGRYEEAEASFREGVRLQPANAGARCTLAIVLAKQKKNQEAVAILNEALKIDPANKTAREYLRQLQPQ